MGILLEMQFGSHVYGTNLESSDLDFKGIFVPEARDILLQRAQLSASTTTKKDKDAKNSSTDVDREFFSLQKFIDLACSGQTICIDMLFVPKQFLVVQNGGFYDFLVEHRTSLLSKRMSAFVGYCRAQASKFCVKASRLDAVSDTIKVLMTLPHAEPLGRFEEQLRPLTEKHPEFVKLAVEDAKRSKMLACCGRFAHYSSSVKTVLEIYEKVLRLYGDRAKAARNTSNLDTKALYHALRIARQAEELLTTHHITFPRPEAPLLLKIRQNEVPYQDISEMLDEGLARVEHALTTTTLPDAPDTAFWEEFVLETYRREILTNK